MPTFAPQYTARVIGPAHKIYIVADSAVEGSPLLVKLNGVRRMRITHAGDIELAGLLIGTAANEIGDTGELVFGE